MSTENITRFAKAVLADPKLAQKINVLRQEPSAPEKIAALAAELGFPVTTEEVCAYQASSPELSDEALENVAGGFGNFHKSETPSTQSDPMRGYECRVGRNGEPML